MEGGLLMPNPCRAHSPLGLAPAFLCLPIIPLPTGPNAGLSKGEALATPLWLSSVDLFIPVWRKLMHFNMIFFWRLFWLLKTSFKSSLCYEVVLSSFDLPACFCSTVCWPTETTKCVCVFSVTMCTVVQGNQRQVAGPLRGLWFVLQDCSHRLASWLWNQCVQKPFSAGPLSSVNNLLVISNEIQKPILNIKKISN